jgi:hypothetical protein
VVEQAEQPISVASVHLLNASVHLQSLVRVQTMRTRGWDGG